MDTNQIENKTPLIDAVLNNDMDVLNKSIRSMIQAQYASAVNCKTVDQKE